MKKYNFMNKGSLQKKNKKSVTFVTLGGGSRSVFVTLFKNMFKMYNPSITNVTLFLRLPF